MKILVCRPESDAIDLVNKLYSNGLTAIKIPTIKICYKKINKDIINYTSLIFTSKYAIKSLFNQYSIDLFKNKKIYSIGESTAVILKNYGFDFVIYPKNHGSQELLNIILKDNIFKDKFAIISGVSGNNFLSKELSKLTECFKFETYSRIYVKFNELLNSYNKCIKYHHQLDIVITTSIDIFKSLNRIFKKMILPKSATITITSSKMLKFVNQQGFKNTLKLEKLNNNYISEKVIKFIKTNNKNIKIY